MEIKDLVKNSYLQQPQVIETIWTEALTTKALLLDKGLITLNEFEKKQVEMAGLLGAIIQTQVAELRRTSTKANVLLDTIESL